MVRLRDSEGRELLTRMRRRGAMLVSAGVLMKAIVEEIETYVLNILPTPRAAVSCE